MQPRDVIELSDNESEFSGSIALFKIRDDVSESSVFGDAERDDTFAVPSRVSSKAKSSRKRNNFMKNVSRNPGVHVKIPTQVNDVASNATHVPKKTNSRNPSKNIKVLLEKISTSKQEENYFPKDTNTYDKFSSSSKLPDKYFPHVLLERVSVPDKKLKSSQEQPDDQQSKDDDKISNNSHQDPQLINLPFVLVERISVLGKKENTRADNILRKSLRKSSNLTINSGKHELSASIPDKKHKCDHCDYATNVGANFYRHMKIHSGGPLFKCTDCNFESLYFDSLQRHRRNLHARESLPIRNLHEKPRTFVGKKHKCDRCNYATNVAAHFDQHMKIHFGGPLFKCTHCSFETLYPNNLQRHKRHVHARKSLPVGNLHEKPKTFVGKKHKCDRCNYATDVTANFDQHMKIHSGGPLLKCTHCNFETLYSNSLERHRCNLHARESLPIGNLHEKSESVVEKNLKCNVCNFRTDRAGLLDRHMKIHFGGSLFKCTDCNFESLYFDSLERHRRNLHAGKSLPVGNLHKKPESVGEKKHKCDHCNFETNRARCLSVHMKTHVSGPFFKCTDCNFETLRSVNLKNHKLLHASEPLTCPYCPFTAFGIRPLNSHIYSHPEADKLECDICHFKFTRLCNFTTHWLSYHTSCATTDAKLTCSICQKVFADKYSLMIHKKTYKNGDIYTCKKCSYTTRYAISFKNHLTKHLNK